MSEFNSTSENLALGSRSTCFTERTGASHRWFGVDCCRRSTRTDKSGTVSQRYRGVLTV